MPLSLSTPLMKQQIKKLKAGQIVHLSGTLFTARDKAHQRILEFIRTGKKLPFGLSGGVIFHAGPITQKDKNWGIVAIGPTTSARMNSSTFRIVSKFNLPAIIGKGGMTPAIFKKGNTVYLAPTGGCSALLTQQIKKVQNVYWLDLSPAEAVWELQVENFGPLVVGIDSKGNSLYHEVEKKVTVNLKKLLR